MKKELIENSRVGEKYYRIIHPTGLTVYVMELSGFSGTTAMFGTKYGSVNTSFRTDADEDIAVVPEGIAHFLEHKLFENDDSQVYDLFAKTGASANAYTSFDSTVYYFDCTSNFEKSLEILLDFVQRPYFTKETVDKEQGIIAQEIKMCEDNPYRRVYFNLLRAIYHNHPVRTEIAGTVESIGKIDAELLYRCYNTFYNLNNMVLAVVGNCKVDEVIAVADKMLSPCKNIGLKTFFPDEPETVAADCITEKMSVGVPVFSIGYKCAPSSGRELLKREYASAILMSMLFGTSSEFYKRNSESGLINPSFETETDDGEGYFMNSASGESEDPKRVYELMNEEIARAKREGLSREEFEEQKKSRYGTLVRMFNNVSASASGLLSAHIAGCGAFDSIEVLANLEFDEVYGMIGELLDPERSSLSVIEPITE